MEPRARNPPSASSSHLRPDSPPARSPPGKRKADGTRDVVEKRRRLELPAAPQSTRLVPSISGLPGQIWQNVFLYLPPLALGRLLQVNRAFHTILTQVDEPDDGSQRISGPLRVVSHESIWSSARKAYFPTLPKPLIGRSELDMWRLLKGRRCQFCGKPSRSDCSPTGLWEGGPGADGVRVVWPFGIRTCGRCLEGRSQSEQSLLFTVTALLAALPCVFVTQHLHVVPSSILGSATSPPNITISKWYYREHVQEINREFEYVRALGPAAGEEWFKGLEDVGRRRLADAERWERWERKGGLHELVPTRRQGDSPPSLTPSHPPEPAPSYTVPRQLPMNGVPRAVAPYGPQYPSTSAEQRISPQYMPPGATQHPRPERSIRDANEAKAARKAEIERRCQEFNPPIVPNVLRHMKAFQAACQISSPLTEKAWEILQPRLEAQRDEAEKVEHERAAQMAALQVKLEDRRQQDASLKEVREVLEREWEEVQAPVRERLGAYVDEIVQRDWMNGRSITRDNSPQFAADLLIKIRSRFYADLAQEDENTLASGQEIREDPPTGPPTRRLLLENMKWVFDNKIKPLTEQFRKELFLCHGEGCEGNPKWYGFEGIIQHYGAKHTTAFSVGNVVVCWKEADWPEEPPFHPEPSKARHGFYGGYPSSSMSTQGPPQHAYSALPYGGYSQGANSTPHVASRTPLPFPQSSPGPYGQYGLNANGPFPPPPAPTSANFYGSPPGPHSQPFGPPPGSFPPYAGSSQAQWHDGSYSYDSYGTSQFQPSHGTGYTPSGANFGPPPGFSGYGDPAQGQFGPQPATAAPGPYGPFHGGPHHGSPPALAAAASRGPAATNLYRDQLQVLMDVARDFWTSTAGIRDLAPSVRLCVVIYHILYHFNLRFGIEPSLDLFADALDSAHSMHPLNAVNGLRCRACAMGFHNHAPHFNSSSSHSSERNFFSLLSLLLHFKSEHMEGAAPGTHEVSSDRQVDWKKDMIELPEDEAISTLIQSPGMDDHKLRIIADAFPKFFPSPLPHIGAIAEAEVPETGEAVDPPPETSSGPTDDQAEPRREPTPGPRPRPPNLSRHDFGDSPAAKSPMVRPPSGLPSGEHDYIPRHHEAERDHDSRPSRGHIERLHSPPHSDRRMRVYYDEPRYYVARDLEDRDYSSRHHRDPYVPLSPAASRRYSHIGRVYEEAWDRHRREREERYTSERDFDSQDRVPTRAGLRYLDRPELSAAASPANPVRPESRQVNDEAPDENTVKQEPRSPMPPDVEAVADRFLDDLATGDRFREYVSRAARDEEQMETEDRTRQSSRVPNDALGGPDNLTDAPTSQADSVRDHGYDQYAPRGGHRTVEPDASVSHRYTHEPRSARDDGHRSAPRRDPEPRRYTYAPSRYRRVSMYREDPYYQSPRLVRTRGSRYGRYEATRRRLEQSKSPTREGTVYPESRHRSERRSPDPSVYDGRYRGESRYPPPPPSHEYTPYDDRGRYSPDPPPGYRYSEVPPPPPTYVNEYGEVIEYVRIREPYHERRFVADHPPEGPGHRYVEYVPYEREHRYEPVPDDRHYVYYPERRPYVPDHERGPYFAEHERRSYEMDASVPPPPLPPGPPTRGREREREARFVDEAM